MTAAHVKIRRRNRRTNDETHSWESLGGALAHIFACRKCGLIRRGTNKRCRYA